jgi:uncharacterized membrane-anchored protein
MRKTALYFGLAVLLQIIVLACVPAGKIYTRTTGTTVILKVGPVDPYSVMRGYFVTLSYDISRPREFEDIVRSLKYMQTCYTVLERDPQDRWGSWRAVSIHTEFPRDLQPGQVAIKGKARWRILYGIEEYYIPEGRREEIGDALRKHREDARVEVKVDRRGNAALIRLLIGDKAYEY